MSEPVAGRRPTVVHVGAFDLASYGDLLFPLVSAAELGRRCDAVLRPFGPFGTPPIDDRLAVWALPRWSDTSSEQVARLGDLVLVGGGEIGVEDGRIYAPFYGVSVEDAAGTDRWLLEGPSAPGVPKVWHCAGVPGHPTDVKRWRAALEDYALVAVRDEQSAAILRDVIDFDRVRVVPDTALLLSRLASADTLAATVTSLRSHGRVPVGPYAAVQGNGTMVPFAPDHAAAVHAALPADWGIVAFCASPCHLDQQYAEAFAAACPRRVRLLGVEATVDAVMATLAAAGLVVSVSLHAAITAVAFDRPSVTLDPFGQRKLGAFLELADRADRHCTDIAALPELIDAARTTRVDPAPRQRLQAQVDDYFDELATLATVAARRHDTPATPPTTMRAAVAWAELDAPPRLPQACPLGTSLVDRADHAATPDVAALVRRVQRDADDLRSLHVRTEEVETALAETERTAHDRAGAIEHLEGVVAANERDLAEARDATAEAQVRAEAAAALTAELQSRVEALEHELAVLRNRGLFRRIVPPKS